MKPLLALEVLFCLALCSAKESRNQRQAPSGYDRDELPEDDVQVDVGLHIRNIEYVSTVDRKYKTQLLVRMSWLDERLVHSSEEEHVSFPTDQVWTPDVYFSNDLQTSLQNSLKDDHTVQVNRAGIVHLTQRVSVELSCPMDLHNFPFDIQRCPLILSSWSTPLSQLKLEWYSQPVVVNRHALSVSDFNLRRFETDNCTSTTPTGVYACLQVNLTMKRMFYPYLIRLYIPLAVCVIIASFSFWIQCSPVRIVLLMVDLLAAAAVVQVAVYSATIGDYTSYVDIFSGVSLAFVFLALLEFVVVQYVFKRELMSEKLHSMMNDIRSNGLDIICRVLVPLLYGFFVTAYFAVAFFLLDDHYSSL